MTRIDITENARSLLARLTFFMSKRRVGKVVTPIRVHALHTPLLYGLGQMELSQEKANQVSPQLKLLIQLRTAMQIGCPF